MYRNRDTLTMTGMSMPAPALQWYRSRPSTPRPVVPYRERTTMTMTGMPLVVPALVWIKRPPRYATRVRIKRGGEWVDITSRVEYGIITHTNEESAVSTMELHLLNGAEHDSIVPKAKDSPMNQYQGQYMPLLDRYNEIVVEAAVSYDGSEPVDFVPGFGGYLGDEINSIDDIEEGVTIPLFVRDYAKQLQDDYITDKYRYENMYASAIIQDLLTKRYNEGHLPSPISLRVIGTDDFWVEEVEFEDISTWDAIQSFARQSNKDIRFLPDGATGTFRLTYWTPSTAMVPGWIIEAKDILHEELQTSDAGNRYRIRVRWRDQNGALQESVYEDQTARKPNEPLREIVIGESDTYLIRSQDAADRFGNAVLSALKSEPGTDSLVIPFQPEMRLFDVIQVANPNVRSEPELFAIDEISHHFDAEEWRTEVVASRSVKLRPDYWLSLEKRRGVNDIIPPEVIGGGHITMPKPVNVVVSSAELGLVVHVPVPPVHANRWSITEVHVSTQQGFEPSPATRLAANRSTYFEVGHLQPGTTYYVRAIYVDINGNRSEPSDEESAVPTHITAGMLDASLFAIEPSSVPAPSSGSLEDLWDMDETTGCTFPSAPITITFRYPVYQGSDLVELHLQANATGYVQMRQRDTGDWIDVLGNASSPVSFVVGWNRRRFDGNKLYFGREYRLVLLDNVRINELRFERVTVADLILAGKLRLTGDMRVETADASTYIDSTGITVAGSPAASQAYAERKIHRGPTPPKSPLADDLWLDTSQTPNKWWRYDAVEEDWISATAADIQDIEDIPGAHDFDHLAGTAAGGAVQIGLGGITVHHGKITITSTDGNTIFTGDRWEVYDDNNVLRVRIGRLD